MTVSEEARPHPDDQGDPQPGGWSFLAAGGVMGSLIAALDWSHTPLGPIAGWPPHLRTAVGIMCESRHPMLIWWGDEFTMLYNDAFMHLAGTKHPAGLGSSGREMFADIWDTIGPMLAGVLRTGTATWVDDQLLMMNRRGRDEETYWTYSYSPVRAADGTVDGVFTATTDTTARVQGERGLRTLRELGEISAVTAPTVEQACTAALDVLAGNRADVPFASVYLLNADAITATRAAFYGMTDDPRIVPARMRRDRDGDRPIWAVLGSGHAQVLADLGPYRGLFTPTGAPTGDAEPDSVVAVPLAGAGAGAPMGVLFAGVSPYRTLDQQYRRFLDLVAGQVATAIADAAAYQAQHRRAEELAELDRAKTEFFTGVSHELRTPLTLITGPAEDGLGDVDDPLSTGQRARMELIARNGGRLRRLVDTLLEFARLEGGALVPDRVAVDLAALTRGIGASFAPAVTRAGLEFAVDCPDLDGALSVDVDMWEKIVLNLLSNAVKYTATGRVELALRSAGDGAVELRVADTGIGIAADEQARLFRRFHRVRGAAGRSHEGSGIGLALVAELATLHGGSATVQSRPGRGSTFVVTLPAAARTTAAPSPREASPTVRLYRDEALRWSDDTGPADGRPPVGTGPAGAPAGTRVLVAEDNPDLRRFVAGLLEPYHTVLLAADGDTALECARRERPDLVLTDVMMPGLDGFELLAALRADPATAAIPVIVLSARAGEEAVGEGLAAGADDYLVKPFSSVDLLARVRSNLAMARLRSREGAWRSALVDALQDALVVVDADGRVVEINDAFTEVLGYGAEGLPYAPPFPWWPDPVTDPDDFAQVIAAFGAVQASGGRFLVPQRHRDGRRLWLEVSASTMADPHGDGQMVVGVFRDVTAQHRATQRDRLLAETGRLLTQPGGLAERLAGLTAAAAPVLADLAVVSLAGVDGRFTAVAAAHRNDPAAAETVLSLAPHTVPESLRSDYRAGRAFVLDGIPDPMPAEATGGEADLAARRTLFARSGLVVPLVVAGRLLGSLTFASTQHARTHDAADLALAEELGRRVAGVVEAERVATREHQLHTATTALAEAATLAEAADALSTAVATTTGATGIAVYVAHAHDPHLQLIHTTGYPPEVAQTFARIRTDAALPVAAAARSRAAVWLGDQHAWRERYPHMAVPSAGAADAAHAVAALPLLIGDRVVGVLAASFPTARAFPADERSFAMTLAGQAATAFDRAAIADAHFQIARTLQRSLLPTQLPTLPRLALAAHYEPAGQYAQAGGDWYDVITLGEERVAIVVGDVVGSGAGAAAVMGQLRSALAGFLLESHAPAHALTWLSRLAQQIDGALGSTAICLVLHTGTGQLRWAGAGHPPPLLLTPASAAEPARYLHDGHGPVLGIPAARGVAYLEGHTVLAPGSSILLYTDGLVERRGDVIDDGLDRIAAAAGEHPDASPGALISAVLAAALDDRGPADDIALIVTRFLPAPLRQRLPARPEQLSALRRALDDWTTATALPDEQAEDLQLALGEAVANSVEHAYAPGRPGEFDYHVEHGADGAVHVEVRDHGTWRPEPPDPGFRGRGLAMIFALARDVTLDTGGPGTRIRFSLPAPPPAPDPVGAPAARRQPDAVPGFADLRVQRGPGGALTLRLRGELDLTTIGTIRAELLRHLDAGTAAITLDTREVTYLASAGVGMLVQAVAAAPGRIRLDVRPGSPTARILALTGLDRHLPGPAGRYAPGQPG